MCIAYPSSVWGDAGKYPQSHFHLVGCLVLLFHRSIIDLQIIHHDTKPCLNL